ncbi:9080_t:CDS:2 [Entrophospora sp. SA101]|nr:9080_t:CDS:2 [Entrophospora sp. SA101]
MQHIKSNSALVSIARQNARNFINAKNTAVLTHNSSHTGGFSNRGTTTTGGGNGVKYCGSKFNQSSQFSTSSNSLLHQNFNNNLNSINDFFNSGLCFGNSKSDSSYNHQSFFSTDDFNNHILEIIQASSSNTEKLFEIEKEFSSIKNYGLTPNTQTYNLLLETICKSRLENYSISKLKNYFNQMLKEQIEPDFLTFFILIKNICKRDHEIYNQKNFWELRLKMDGDDLFALKKIENINAEEKNLDFALGLFKDSLIFIDYDGETCDMLLRSLAERVRVEDAMFIFHYMSTNNITSQFTYCYLISLYGNLGDIEKALEYYNEYISTTTTSYYNYNKEPLSIYNYLISAYIRCSDITSALNIIEEIIPENGLLPNEWSYYYLIRDLCAIGEIDLAEEWFSRLRDDPSLPNPSAQTYSTLLLYHSTNGDYQKAAEIYYDMKTEHLHLKYLEFSVYLYSTVNHDPNNIKNILDDSFQLGQAPDYFLTKVIIDHYLENENPLEALDIMTRILINFENSKYRSENITHYEELLNKLILDSRIDLKDSIDMKFKFYNQNFRIPPLIHHMLIKKYNQLKCESTNFISQLKSLPDTYITCLFDSFGAKIFLFEKFKDKKDKNIKYVDGLLMLMKDFVSAEITIPYNTARKYHEHLKGLNENNAAEEWDQLYSKMYSIDKKMPTKKIFGRQPTMLEINRSSELANICRGTTNIEVDAVLKGIKKMLSEDLLPTPELISQAIRNLGKARNLKEAKEIYELSLEFCNQWDGQVRDRSLYYSRNSMLVAYASNHMVDEAFQIYNEIIESGHHPDASAYADLLVAEGSHDPDEASTALKLYSEIKRFNIRPTIYLYNVLISKLGKARKYDLVWETYEDMKKHRISPNVITYSALISACTRVKSEEKAISLFQEMENSPNFQPRIGPYNTMMQFYTWDLHNREKAFKYFDEIQKYGLLPSEHTYKLLIDAYVTIEPFDTKSALDVFEQMRVNGSAPQATHYASLIYGYGCCQGDIENALNVFNTMESLYNVRPDENAYQALFDALIANNRMEEAEEYYELMLNQEDVESTPYIENLFIRGYGQLGQWERAETVFENMIDLNEINDREGVPREPSTYEEMVKAFVINGEVEKAKEVAGVLEHKYFPETLGETQVIFAFELGT